MLYFNVTKIKTINGIVSFLGTNPNTLSGVLNGIVLTIKIAANSVNPTKLQLKIDSFQNLFLLPQQIISTSIQLTLLKELAYH